MPPEIVNVSVCMLPELTTLTMFGDMSSAAGVGASIVIVAVVVFPKESNTFSVTSPAVTFAGKVTVMGVPFVVLVFAAVHTPFPNVVLKALEGSLEVVI